MATDGTLPDDPDDWNVAISAAMAEVADETQRKACVWLAAQVPPGVPRRVGEKLGDPAWWTELYSGLPHIRAQIEFSGVDASTKKLMWRLVVEAMEVMLTRLACFMRAG